MSSTFARAAEQSSAFCDNIFMSEQQRAPADEADALRRLERFIAIAGDHARALGIEESDIPRLVKEVRREDWGK